MALTRKRIVTGISILYLLALTAIAAYALHSANVYNLPIPNGISALAVALPALAGVALETVLSLHDTLARRGQLQASRVVQVVVAAFIILESVLATLAGTYLSPLLGCALGDKWRAMRHAKDAEAIRWIQDAFSCCGFNSVRDMAWPFEDARHGADACVIRYERTARCLEPWRGEERKVAIMLLVVPMAVFVWKVAILFVATRRSSWLPSHIRLPEDESQSEASAGARQPRAAIAYRHLVEEEGQSRDDSLQRAVTGLNKDSHLASHVEGNRRKPAGLLDGSRPWRDEHVDD